MSTGTPRAIRFASSSRSATSSPRAHRARWRAALAAGPGRELRRGTGLLVLGVPRVGAGASRAGTAAGTGVPTAGAVGSTNSTRNTGLDLRYDKDAASVTGDLHDHLQSVRTCGSLPRLATARSAGLHAVEARGHAVLGEVRGSPASHIRAERALEGHPTRRRCPALGTVLRRGAARR